MYVDISVDNTKEFARNNIFQAMDGPANICALFLFLLNDFIHLYCFIVPSLLGIINK